VRFIIFEAQASSIAARRRLDPDVRRRTLMLMMMNRKHLLLKRLDGIGLSLASTGKALALIGLGSAGIETDRLDEYSDLDFFVVVQAGYKKTFIENLDWLSAVCPIAYCFKNTVDGYKLLFEDGVYCEFVVFEEPELATASFAEGRIVWRAPGVADSIRISQRKPMAESRTVEWMVGEAITCLYVGLCRHHRGEKLSAMRFIQQYAVDRILELSGQLEAESPAHKDLFSLERRYEQRFPTLARELPRFMQGYARNRESAQAILEFLDRHLTVNAAMKARILELCDQQVHTGD
jgi:lincosamide nucleotidyltransferase